MIKSILTNGTATSNHILWPAGSRAAASQGDFHQDTNPAASAP